MVGLMDSWKWPVKDDILYYFKECRVVSNVYIYCKCIKVISKTRVELPRRCRQGDLVMPSEKRVRDVRVNAVSTCRLALDSEKTSDHRGCCWRRERVVSPKQAQLMYQGKKKGNGTSFHSPPKESGLLRLSRAFSATLTGRFGMGMVRMGAEGRW
jgi:hypothetical protein